MSSRSSNPPPHGPPISSTAVKVHRCTVDGCEKTFSRKSNLKAHMRLHTGEEPYACPDCGKKFKWKSCMASHERVHSRRTDHPLTASAYARRAELQSASPARRRNQHSALPDVNHTADAFVAELQMQQENQWRDPQQQQHVQQTHARSEHVYLPEFRQQQTQRHLQEQQRISQQERLEYYQREQRLKQLQQQFQLTDNQNLPQHSAPSQNPHNHFDPNSDIQQGYASPTQQYLPQHRARLPSDQSQNPPNVPYHHYQSPFQHEQTAYAASNSPRHGDLYYPPPQDYTADPILYPQPPHPQPLPDHTDSAVPPHEDRELVRQAQNLSLLDYFNTSTTDREVISRRHLSTDMTPIVDAPAEQPMKPVSKATPFQLNICQVAGAPEVPKAEDAEFDHDSHFKPDGTSGRDELRAHSRKSSNDALCPVGIPPTESDPANLNGSIDFNLTRTPKEPNIDMEMIPYFNKQRSRSTSDRPMSIDSKIFADTTPEIGSSYFTREPSAPLDRLSGELKYNGNGKWSCNMSDILNVGVEPDRSGSFGRLSLILPELGNGFRGLYSNSVSPLGMTLTNPVASPRTSLAYMRSNGFVSPQVSQSFQVAEK